MVTGALHADAAVILVDARRGVPAANRRHTYIAHLLGVRHIVVAVNKMDLVRFRTRRHSNASARIFSPSPRAGIVDLR